MGSTDDLTPEERIVLQATRLDALAVVRAAGAEVAERRLLLLLDRARRARAKPVFIAKIEEALWEVSAQSLDPATSPRASSRRSA